MFSTSSVVLNTALMTFARLMNWVLARVILVEVAWDGIFDLGFWSLKSDSGSRWQERTHHLTLSVRAPSSSPERLRPPIVVLLPAMSLWLMMGSCAMTVEP